jgi:hypothetical protein
VNSPGNIPGLSSSPNPGIHIYLIRDWYLPAKNANFVVRKNLNNEKESIYPNHKLDKVRDDYYYTFYAKLM